MNDTKAQTAEGKVLWHFTMSLNGFVAGPDHEMDWMAGTNRPGLIDEYITTTGAVLEGRAGWDMATASGGRPYGGDWDGPIFVLTHHPEDATPAEGVITTSSSICRRPADRKEPHQCMPGDEHPDLQSARSIADGSLPSRMPRRVRCQGCDSLLGVRMGVSAPLAIVLDEHPEVRRRTCQVLPVSTSGCKSQAEGASC
jgi:hypothetical protein